MRYPSRLVVAAFLIGIVVTTGFAGETSAQQPSASTFRRPSRADGTTDKPIKVQEVVIKEARERELESAYTTPDATTATKTDTPILKTPASIQVVPKQVIQEQQIIRLEDAFRNVSGVQTSNTGGNVSTIGSVAYLRGFANFLPYRNGFPTISLGPVDVSWLQRIEILKGPASVLYGQTEVGGLVNLISKPPLTTPYYEAQMQIGNYGLYRPSFDITGPLTDDKRWLYRLNGAYMSAGSFRDFVDQDRKAISPSVTWNPSNRTSITFDLTYTEEHRVWDDGIPFLNGTGLPANLPNSRYLNDSTLDGSDISDLFASYRLVHELRPNLKIRNVFQYHRFDHELEAARRRSVLPDNTMPRQYDRQSVANQEFQLLTDVLGKFQVGPTGHELLAGVDLRYAETGNIFRRSPFPAINIFNPTYGFARPTSLTVTTFDTTLKWAAIYIQDQIALPGNFTLLAGGRYDYVQFEQGGNFGTGTTTPTAFTPRLGLLYQIIEPVSAYVSYSESFFPGFSGGIQGGGPSLKPQRGRQYEAGIKTETFDRRLRTTVAVYQIKKTNVPVFDPVAGFSVNAGEQRSQGIELDILGEPIPGLNIIASYAYTDTKVLNSDFIPRGNRFQNIPLHSGSLWTTYTLQEGTWKGLGGGAGVFTVSDRQGNTGNTFSVPGFARVDLAGWYPFTLWGQSLFAQINVKNLLNTRYAENAETGFIQHAWPLTVFGSLSYRFW